MIPSLSSISGQQAPGRWEDVEARGLRSRKGHFSAQAVMLLFAAPGLKKRLDVLSVYPSPPS